MTKHVMMNERQERTCELFELEPSEELISEEQRPSLLNVSLTESVCSDATIDLEQTPCAECQPVPSTCNSTGPASMELGTTLNNNYGKSMSLHDVSNILPMQLSRKSTNTLSCETIHSQSLSSTTKSKDSGFHRSTSCLSLTSSRRTYDHVQSKVKAYIRNIKESEALRKKNKLSQQIEVIDEPVTAVDECSSLDKEDLIVKIRELEHELCEKAQYIDVQQELYNSLLFKLAQAKSTIDTLRLRQLSWNYSSVNESLNMSSKLDENCTDLELFISEIIANSKTPETSKNITPQKENGVVCKEKQISDLQPSNCSLPEKFRPRKHSTPDKKKSCKRLSPVSKMFSSSSRLDRNIEPLSKLNQGKSSNSLVNTNTSVLESCHQCSAKVSVEQTTAGARSNNTKPRSIDLPNVDPFDKVKKWQASLPNINLVGTHSSSDCDASEPQIAVKDADDVHGKESSLSTHKQKEDDIYYALSQQLEDKCRISDVEELPTALNKKLSSKSGNIQSDYQTKLPSYNDNLSPNTHSQFQQHKDKLNSSLSQYRTSNKKPSRRKRLNIQQRKVLLESDDSSSSECESRSYLPKSSSHSQAVDKLKRRSSDDEDDSSSVSSSVLGSPSLTKRRFSTQINGLNKVHKLSSRTNFTLREPKLNVTVPVKDILQAKNQRSYNSDSNCKSSNTNQYFKTESSQRKAWNARNNTNFYVCKEFCLQKSSSLQECHLVMEGMVRKGSSIIGEILDRSNY